MSIKKLKKKKKDKYTALHISSVHTQKRKKTSPWPSFNSHIPSVVILLMGTPFLG